MLIRTSQPISCINEMGWVREDTCSSKLFQIHFSEVQHQKMYFTKTNTKAPGWREGKKRRRKDLSVPFLSSSADLHSKKEGERLLSVSESFPQASNTHKNYKLLSISIEKIYCIIHSYSDFSHNLKARHTNREKHPVLLFSMAQLLS